MKKYTLGLYEKAMPPELTWKEKLMTAKAAGYDFLEISIDETDEKISRLYMSREELIRLKQIIDEAGFPIGTMCLSAHRRYPIGSSDEKTAAYGMEIMERAVSFAETLGIRIIQLAGYDVYYEESTPLTVRRFGENLERAAEMAARAGIMLGFETMETDFMNTVGKAVDYVRAMNSPYLNVYPDVGNITNAACKYSIDVAEDIKKGNGRIVAAHLKETRPGVFREVPFGEGHVDFERVINVMWKVGVRRYVVEFWYVGNSDWKDILVLNRRKMERMLAKTAKRTDYG
ncbi:MAG: L-ribulose-5-phosphate 3-epimerase [Dorea sp.]|nr:L-ribulose-5-phosphate 3-epimerase [Dorea sp.]